MEIIKANRKNIDKAIEILQSLQTRLYLAACDENKNIYQDWSEEIKQFFKTAEKW